MWGSGGNSRLGCYSNQNPPCESLLTNLCFLGPASSPWEASSLWQPWLVATASCPTLLSLGVCVVAFMPHCYPVHFLLCLSVNLSLPPYSKWCNFSLKAFLSTTRQVTLPQDTSALPLPHIPMMIAYQTEPSSTNSSSDSTGVYSDACMCTHRVAGVFLSVLIYKTVNYNIIMSLFILTIECILVADLSVFFFSLLLPSSPRNFWSFLLIKSLCLCGLLLHL